MTDIKLGLRPTSKSWDKIDYEVFFEEPKSIIVELHNLDYLGRGHFQDSKTGANERVSFKSPVNTAQFIFKLSEK